MPKFVLGNNNSQGTFFFQYLVFVFGNIHPRYSTITGFGPQNGLCTAHSTAQGSGVRRGAARETRQSAVIQV